MEAQEHIPRTVADLPWEQRTEAIIMNVGWNDTRAVVEERASKALLDAGVPVDSHTKPTAQRDLENSQVLLTFRKPEELRMARLKIQALKRCAGGSAKILWLDAQKTRSELEPGRMIGRAKNFLKRVLDAKDGVWQITGDLRERRVFVDNVPVGAPAGTVWEWLPTVDQHMNELEQRLAKSWIEET